MLRLLVKCFKKGVGVEYPVPIDLGIKQIEKRMGGAHNCPKDMCKPICLAIMQCIEISISVPIKADMVNFINIKVEG